MMIRMRRRALSLIEIVISTVVVSGMLVASLNVYGMSKMTEMRTYERTQGHLLAEQLMAEILLQPYEEMEDTASWGLELGEENGTRKFFDDVDDYVDWKASPPVSKGGEEMTEFEGWTRAVLIDRRDPDELSNTRAMESGIKQIVVVVNRGDKEVARLTAIKCHTSPL
ncbi:MAG: type IV pilus modification PilV family protein [Phycisphaerae bacterium]